MGFLLILVLLGAVAALRYGTFGERPRRIGRIAVQHGLVIGGISFVAGFIGPIIFAPEANQGPLLGIFITGPLGFLVGLIIGAVRGYLAKPEAEGER